jgi:hypothetical protein
MLYVYVLAACSLKSKYRWHSSVDYWECYRLVSEHEWLLWSGALQPVVGRGNVTLKFVLSSLTIFQCVTLPMPKCILGKISRNIRSFLWEGGNSNTKKFYLINWHIVYQPVDGGGFVQISNEYFLGSKSSMEVGLQSAEWWKKVLLAKYLCSPRLWFLDVSLPNTKGSPLWKLLNSVAPLIQSKLSWAPRNGYSINLCSDNIMVKESIEHIQDLNPLKNWSIGEGFTKLSNISRWDEHGKWI